MPTATPTQIILNPEDNAQTVALKNSASNINATIVSIDKNTVIKKQATKNIKVEKENILAYVAELLSVPTDTIAEENPLFAGTNILYLYLQAHLANIEVQDTSTNKVIDLILWTVKMTGINPLNLIDGYRELEVLKKYFNNLAITEGMTRDNVQGQLNLVIRFEQVVSNFLLGKESANPTPVALRKAETLKPLWAELKGEGKKIKEFDYVSIVDWLSVWDAEKAKI